MRRQIHRHKEVGLINRKGQGNNGSRRWTTIASLIGWPTTTPTATASPAASNTFSTATTYTPSTQGKDFLAMLEEDPQAHILRLIDWINTHNFAEGQRVQTFPIILAGEARLWYQSIYLFQGKWEEL